MKLLLDTHTFLWFIAGDTKLNSHAQELITDPSNERFLSVASIWEITIKSSLGRLKVPMPPTALIHEHIWANAIEILHVAPDHFDVLHTLPAHHKDPFDRLMIAQAIEESMVVISKDQVFSAYNVQTVWEAN